MAPHDTPDPDRIDPLAPRPDDPWLGRGRTRLYDPPRGRRIAPLVALGMTALAVATAIAVVLLYQFS